MQKKLFSTILTLTIIFGFALATTAEMQSEDCRISCSGISGGGAPITSLDYHMNATLNKSSPLMQGDQKPSSDNYNNNPEFWYTEAEPEGVLEGKVWFVGTPCAPGSTSKVPPCGGPYANYAITVYRDDGVAVKAQIHSNVNGEYRIGLAPGDYIIYTPKGVGSEQANAVTILSGEKTRLDLVIDTGVR
jgi:hypothetical protein